MRPDALTAAELVDGAGSATSTAPIHAARSADGSAVELSVETWDGGWLASARRCESPNFGPRPAGAAIDLLLLHSISLPPGVYGGDAIEHLFTNRLDWEAHPYYAEIRGLEVSAHFVVRRDGELVQFVSCDERAWHAGRSQWRGRPNCNDYSIGIELEGLEGTPFEPPQYATLATLIAALLQRYPIAAVAGHEHVAAGRKGDPGSGFDWAWLRSAPGMADKDFPEATPPIA